MPVNLRILLLWNVFLGYRGLQQPAAARGAGHEVPGGSLPTFPARVQRTAGRRLSPPRQNHVVTRCGRICLGRKIVNFSTVFAAQAVAIKEVHDDIWLVSFMDYDLGYFDLETRVVEPLDQSVRPKSVTHVTGTLCNPSLRAGPGEDGGHCRTRTCDLVRVKHAL